MSIEKVIGYKYLVQKNTIGKENQKIKIKEKIKPTWTTYNKI